MKRKPLIYLSWVFLVMILGITSRKMWAYLPDYIDLYLGDALWALMIYGILGVLFRELSIKKIAIGALLFCYFIEFSQLYHRPWIDNIRSTTLGGLVLGHGFLWSDLMAYGIGIGIGVLIEKTFLLNKRNL
ncbi:MAG: DUF2809 domain-containing protein [Thermotaleaceae bacterium]